MKDSGEPACGETRVRNFVGRAERRHKDGHSDAHDHKPYHQESGNGPAPWFQSVKQRREGPQDGLHYRTSLPNQFLTASTIRESRQPTVLPQPIISEAVDDTSAGGKAFNDGARLRS
jgi:hypothetical protein